MQLLRELRRTDHLIRRQRPPHQEEMPILRIEGLEVRYESGAALKDVSFELCMAERVAVVGPNGAGKSTLFKVIAGVLNPTGGSVDVFGHDPKYHELEIKYLSGVVPQENNLDVELNVRRNLLIYSKFYGIKRAEADKRIDTLLDFMELSDKKRAKIKELSGGMKRRLIIARALLNDPSLLILDEPTTGLDPQVRHLIWNKIRQLKSNGTTILLTTHYMEEAFQIADWIIIMNQGEKIIEGNPKELLEEHMERYVLEVRKKQMFGLLENRATKKVRRDRSSESMLLYCDDPAILKKLSEQLNPGDYFYRETNLEDLFLKLTGRELHEE